MPQSRIRRYIRHGTLSQLAVFEASARLLSFTRAADELHLAQPTVSAQIRKLTQTLGAPLFEQVGKQIRLTEPGRRAYAHCLEVMDVFTRLDDSLADLRDLHSGELRLAVAGASTRFITRMLAGFCPRHPGLAISMRVDNRAGLLARLTAHDDDLYLFARAPDDGSIVRQAILANPLVVMAHPSDPLARERSISLERLAQAPLLLREAGSGTRASVIDLFACAGLTPNVRMELASDEAIRCAVGEGAGIAVLARDTFALEGRADAPVMLDVAGFPLARHWHFAYPVAGRASRAVQAFMRHVRDEVALLPCGAMSHGAQAMAHGSRILQALPCEAQVPAVRHGLFAAVRQKSLSSIHLHSGECSEWRVHRSKRLRPE